MMAEEGEEGEKSIADYPHAVQAGLIVRQTGV